MRHGGFVGGAQRFDARAFGISAAEAGAMDPQQRLLLELGYAALHAASARRAALMGGDGGVFLGIERARLGARAAAVGARLGVRGDGRQRVGGGGRVSFVLGLQGPCSSVDTACASALAALHGGVARVRGWRVRRGAWRWR